MPLPQQPYSPISYSDKVRNTNPVGSWSQIHPTTQKYLVENYGVDPKGTNWMQQPSNLRDAVARYPLATVKGMAAQGRLNTPVNPAKALGSANVAGFAGSLAGAATGGMSGLPLMGMSGVGVKPVAGGATVDLNKGTVTRTKPMGKQGSAMDEAQLFKAAFIAKCIEEGLDIDQMANRVKTALNRTEKRAEGGLLELPTLGLAAIAAGIPLSYLAGHLTGSHVIGPAAYTVLKPATPSKEEIMKDELVSEYERQADILKKQTEYAKRLKERSKGISGVTRY